MKPLVIAGILLVLLGGLALAYQGITYTRHEQVLNVGPLHVTTGTQERIPLPPIIGGVALIGGIALLVVGARKRS